MKIAVFTIPLLNNYGGILQAFALVKFLNECGFGPKLLNLEPNESRFSLNYLKFLIAKIIYYKKYKNVIFKKKQYKKFKKFILENIPLTSKINGAKQLNKVFKKYKFDACIIGSDQVFRP